MGILKFLFSFHGRVGRLAYVLGVFGFAIVGAVVLAALGFKPGAKNQDTVLLAWQAVIGLICCVSGCALGTKRFHDLNKSGWWLFASVGAIIGGWVVSILIPVVGSIVMIGGVLLPFWHFIELLFFKGTAGSNDFGTLPSVMKQLMNAQPATTAEPAWVAQALNKTPAANAQTARNAAVRTARPDANATVVTRVARASRISTTGATAMPTGFGRRNQ